MTAALRAGLAGLAALLLGAGCRATVQPLPTLAKAQVVSDFGSYELRRVGVVPVGGTELGGGLEAELQATLVGEFQRRTDVEWVQLTTAEFDGMEAFDLHLRGGYPTDTILTLTKRHRLDGLLVVTVTDRQAHAPQRLGLQAVLLSAETGLSLWQADVQLDAADTRTRRAGEAWAHTRGSDLSDDHWELVLSSPRRFVALAVHQLADVF